MIEKIKQYTGRFSEGKLWQKLANFARLVGLKVVYMVLLLFFAYRRKETPSWAKNIIIGTLGYFLAPFDAIPDLTPIIGYTDDIGILSFGLVTISAYIDNEVRINARQKLKSWFGEYDESELEEVDQRL